MIIYYKFNDDDFEYEPSLKSLEQAKRDILSELDKKDLIEIIMAEDDIEECFYDEFKDYFEEDAREEYEQEIANSEPPYRPNDFI